ncbi:MAG: hypothetical protein DRN17_06265 [Thermoplasmata archaeon]|nr:MAG: hypothetical protein DRN17_06265 [Thermoplasmata archaeon]
MNELYIYRDFINQLYLATNYSLDSEMIRKLLSNATDLAMAQGMADGSEESEQLIAKRLKNLCLI